MHVKEDLNRISEELEIAIKQNSYVGLKKVISKLKRYIQAFPASLVMLDENEYKAFQDKRKQDLTTEWSMRA